MASYAITPTYILTEAERALVKRIARLMVPSYYPHNYGGFASGCRTAAAQLPPSIHEWRDKVKEMHFGLIRNLPLDSNLPETPTVRHGADDIPMLADQIAGVIAALFGVLYTIEGKGTGRHIHNMYPVIGDEYTQLGSSSMVDLYWHVEEAFHPARPDWISLFCIRSDAGATTKIARARDLCLPTGTVGILRQCRFNLRIDETYIGIRMLPSSVTTCVLGGSIDDPQIVLDPAYTLFQSSIEEEAVAAVEDAAEKSHQRITLMEGDLLLFNNRHVIHGRSAYMPRNDGTDRWLKRTFILEPSSEWICRLEDGRIPFVIEST